MHTPPQLEKSNLKTVLKIKHLGTSVNFFPSTSIRMCYAAARARGKRRQENPGYQLPCWEGDKYHNPSLIVTPGELAIFGFIFVKDSMLSLSIFSLPQLLFSNCKHLLPLRLSGTKSDTIWFPPFLKKKKKMNLTLTPVFLPRLWRDLN